MHANFINIYVYNEMINLTFEQIEETAATAQTKTKK